MKYKRAIDNQTEGAKEAHDRLEYRTWKFAWIFVCLMLLSLYFMNIVNNWGTVPKGDDVYSYGTNQIGYYIKLGNACLCGMLYIGWMVLSLFFYSLDDDKLEGGVGMNQGYHKGGNKDKNVGREDKYKI